MKKIFTFFLCALTLIQVSCERESYLNTGFNIPINKFSTGNINAHVSSEKERIYLKGSIRLLEGYMTISLIDPNGITVYNKTIIAPIQMQIDEYYYAKCGYWQLNYKSNGGIGTIDLHLYNQKD